MKHQGRQLRWEFKQKLYGLTLIALSIIAFVVTSTGTTIRDTDGTGVWLMLMIGIYLLFAKHRWVW